MILQKLNKHSFSSSTLFHYLSVFFLFLLSYSSPLFGQIAETSPIFSPCETIDVRGVFNEDPNSDYFQGIIITGENTPVKIIKIYNSNWERVNECTGDCNFSYSYETNAGKYYVQIQFYNTDWGWICQTENIEVTVPERGNPSVNCDDFAYTLSDIYFEDGQNKRNFELTFNTPSGQITNVDISDRNTGEIVFTCGTDCGNKVFYAAPSGAYVVNYSRFLPDAPTGGCSDIIYFGVARDCENIIAKGVYEKSTVDGAIKQGIQIEMPLSRVTTNAKIYNKDKDLIDEIGGTGGVPFYETGSGNYFVVVELFTIPRIFGEERRLICQTDFLAVTVPNDIVCDCVPSIPGPVCGSDGKTYANSCDAECAGVTWTPGACNTPSCDNIEVIAYPSGELQGVIQVLGLNAPIEIVKIYTENWGLVFECNNDCADFVDYTPESIGKYIVQVQMYTENWEWICQTENIIVEVTQNTDCAANLFLDRDNDGVCEMDDCNDNDPNVGAKQPQGTNCNDGDPNTQNDRIQADGCTCKGTPDIGNPSCEDVQLMVTNIESPTPGVADYAISGLTAPIEIVKIFNRRTYEKLFECNNDCGEGFEIELQEGEYVLQIQMYTADWGWICGKDIEFDVITEDPNPACLDLERILLGDLCNDCVSEVATYRYEGENYYAFLADNVNCADAQTIVYSCDYGSQLCVDGGIIGSTECSTFFNNAVKLQTIWKKSENCPTCICTQEIDPVCGSDGMTYGNPCLADCAGVTWTRGECDQTTPDCNTVQANFQQGLQDTYEGLGVTGLNAPIEIVKIYDADWNRVFECNNNCGSEVVLPILDLSPGLYRVHVQMYTENWEWICETDYLEVTVPNTLGSRNGADFLNEKEIVLFPNPVLSTLNIKTSGLKDKKGRIQIFNTFGQLITATPQKIFNQDYEAIEVGAYQNGLYLLTIQVEDRKVISKRFLVENLK